MSAEQASVLAEFLAEEQVLVADLIAAGWSQTKALRLLGIATSSWHRRTHSQPARPAAKPHTQRRGDAWLTDPEIARITDLLMVAFDDRKSVYQGYHEALDAGCAVASLASWYRIARAYLDALRPARPRRTRRKSAGMPQWEATAVLQVWSWDITYLPGPYKGISYAFYVAIDVFSRKIVAWRVEQSENDHLAKDMFQAAFTELQATPRVVHSDGGASMTSKTLATLFADLGITTSRNRPRVSNDNPFSESLFKTAKYWPGYPRTFASLEQARQWAGQFINHYNNHHRHSALEGHTPASIHNGTWIHIHHARQATLDQLYAANPARYPRRPTVRKPDQFVALNPTRTEHRLQTG